MRLVSPLALALVLAVACDGRVVLGADHGAVACDTTPRDAAQWPFAVDSPWNVPIGDAARYEPVVTAAGPLVSSGLAVSVWSQPVFVAAPGDPVRDVLGGDGSVCAQLAVPDAAMPDPSPGGYLHLVDPTHRMVVELWQAQRAGATITSGDCWVNDLTGPGVYATHHGVRGYGGSGMAGVIRRGELGGGIRHVLAVCAPAASLDGRAPAGPPYVWPASSANDGWQTSYGTSGNVLVGVRLAIPPTVDVDALPIGAEMHRVARALVDFGVYVVDACDGGVGFSAEPAAASEVPADADAALAMLVPLLEVVSDASAAFPGGAGAPRVCPAPPIGPSP